MKQNNKLNESLFEDDLKWLVSDDVLIDMHKTKLGDDADYLVVSLAINDRTPAIDMAKFLENGTGDFDDIEVSPGTDNQGRYLVYIEIERTPELYKIIKAMLTDAGKLCGIDSWKFKSMGMPDFVEFNEELFNSYVITSPEEYLAAHPADKDTDDSETAQPDAKEMPQEESVQESIKKRLKFLLDY